MSLPLAHRVLSRSSSKTARLLARAACATVVGAIGAGLLGGCADSVTFTKSSQERGLAMYSDGNYADAAGAFRNNVRANPKDYQSWYYLGQSQEKMGHPAEALVSYRTSLETQNLTLEGKENRAFRQNTLNALAQAIAKSDSAEVEITAMDKKAHESPSGENYQMLAKVYGFRGDADNALESYTRAMRLERNDFYIIKDYGLYLERLGQPQKAEPLLKRAYTMDPQDAQVDAALRRMGIVPGPALKDRTALAKPAVPEGPIPPINEWTAQRQAPAPANSGVRPAPAPAPAPVYAPQPAAQVPRD
jgi:tetratricopeptide (TPR) repeat protein